MDQDASRPLEFALGQVVITRQALEVLSQRDIHVALVRHQRADWGLVDAADWSANDQAVQHGGRLLSVKDPDRGIELGELRGQTVHAVAGIGNPGRFVSRLRREGLQVIKHVFPDHHPYRHGDIEFGDDLPVVMTEKDAVKCERFATERCWYLPVRAKLADTFIYRLDKCLAEINCG